jgi:hypothetical protein
MLDLGAVVAQALQHQPEGAGQCADLVVALDVDLPLEVPPRDVARQHGESADGAGEALGCEPRRDAQGGGQQEAEDHGRALQRRHLAIEALGAQADLHVAQHLGQLGAGGKLPDQDRVALRREGLDRNHDVDVAEVALAIAKLCESGRHRRVRVRSPGCGKDQALAQHARSQYVPVSAEDPRVGHRRSRGETGDGAPQRFPVLGVDRPAVLLADDLRDRYALSQQGAVLRVGGVADDEDAHGDGRDRGGRTDQQAVLGRETHQAVPGRETRSRSQQTALQFERVPFALSAHGSRSTTLFDRMRPGPLPL